MKAINIINVILVALVIWFAVSWFDVVSNNLEKEPQYKDWNMITMVCDLVE